MKEAAGEKALDDCRISTAHTSNIANVAYENCKILTQYSVPVELYCHDITHVMSQPEWDDLDLDANDFPDENNFYNNTADLGDYKRPDWYHTGSLLTSHVSDENDTDKFLPIYLAKKIVSKITSLSAKLFTACLPYLRKLPLPVFKLIKSFLYWITSLVWRGEGKRLAVEAGRLTEVLRKYGDSSVISKADLRLYSIHRSWMARAMTNADIVFAYVLTPIYMLANHNKPFVAVEIGTMREIPFDGSVAGNLLAAAYREADYVLITNPDVITQAKRLGLERFSFCPHPIDEDRYRPFTGTERQTVRRQLFGVEDDTLVLFAPARQNWALKGNQKYLEAVARCVEEGVKLKLFIPGWGQEVDRSQGLCKKLGIESFVSWIRPMSEGGLVKYFGAADVVLDQFELGVFGLITPKALSCGAVVITSYSPEVNAWCFSEHPPLLPATTTDAIAGHLKSLYVDRHKLLEISQASREWVLEEHSKQRVATTLMEAAAKAREHFDSKTMAPVGVASQ